ncbi:MAG: porin family protein [Pseudomonadota bacterium]
MQHPQAQRIRVSTLMAPFLVLLLGASPGVNAANDAGLYFKALVGPGWLNDGTITFDETDADASFDTGWGAGGELGWRFNNGFRVGGEILYRTNGIKGLDPAPLPGAVPGDFSSLALALNGAYEFPLFGSQRTFGYAGGGLVWIQEIDLDFTVADEERSFSSDGDLGYQLFLGAGYRLGERWRLTGEVRYFDAGTLTLAEEAACSGLIDARYRNTMAQLGVEFRF